MVKRIFSLYIFLGFILQNIDCHALPLFISGAAGVAYWQQQSQSLIYTNTYFNYHPGPNNLQPLVGLSIKSLQSLSNYWSWQPGIGVYFTHNLLGGKVDQGPLLNPAAFNIWEYKYRVNTSQLIFENKLLVKTTQNLYPYLYAAVGGNSTYAYGFKAAPKNFSEVATAIFKNKNTFNFIYKLGFGGAIPTGLGSQMSFSYHVADQGKYALGRGKLDTGNGGNIFTIPSLKFPKRQFNHEFLVELTYPF